MSVKYLLPRLLCLLAVNMALAQSPNHFKPASKDRVWFAPDSRASVPVEKVDAYELDITGLKTTLEDAPWEHSPEAAQHKCSINIPTAHGAQEEFSVWRIAMMEDEIAAAFPNIRTYAGVSLRDARRTVRFSVTPRGMRAMVLNPDFSVAMLKPVSPGVASSVYISYDLADGLHGLPPGATTGLAPNAESWIKEDHTAQLFAPQAESRGQEVDPVRVKVFRFCVAAIGEFTQDHGGTKESGLAAVTEYTNQVSAVFERDINLRLKLTNATQYVIFDDPNTDPYPSGLDNGGYMSMTPEVLNQYTNFNSHDLGHVYIRGGGGVAGGLGVACGQGKARGCSAGMGPNGDYGDDFLFVIGQEVGHQLGGGHTWNHCGQGSNDQRQGLTAFEPGSGSTIMSYAGGCGPDNIQGYGDLYYHAGSIEEIKNYITYTANCGTWEEKTNHPPVVTLSYKNFFQIPISTPFELDGSATDVDGDPLVYSWEGIIYGPETPLGEPQGSTATFRSWPSVDVSNRYFPRLNTILANGFNPAEQLPTYTRDLRFRLTARDNRPDGGGVGWADVEFKATETAGPFLVTSPNSAAAIWRAGELTRVQWDVANTNGALVNCQKVNIRLSTNSGQTYPITLSANTENDGSQYVLVPSQLTSTARVRVEAADNVFFDLSNANFKIQNPTAPSLTLGLSSDGSTICLPENFTIDVVTASVLGYNTPVALSLLGNLPPGATASFSSTNLTPGETATLNIDMMNVAVEGAFSVTVQAISGSDTLLRPIELLLRRNDFTGFVLQSPSNGATGQALLQTLRWGKGLDADTYDVEFSDSPAFTNILASANATALDSLKINFLLEKGKGYYWRVRPINQCGAHAWSDPFFFSTFAENCLSFLANDLPKNISSNGTSTIESKITVVQGGIISDIVVSQIDGYHDYFSDLEAHLISPQGTDVMLWKDRCTSFSGAFKFGMSDIAPSHLTCPPPSNGKIFKSQSPLAPIIGQNSTGTWTLRVLDKVSGAGGTFANFQLQFCQTVNIEPPYVVNNVIMPLPTGTNRFITSDYLLVEDPNNTHPQLTFTLMTVPKRGLLTKQDFGEMKPGDQFTQADIDAGLIRFYDYGISADPDGFQFVVSDGEGGFLGTPTFWAQPLVDTNDPDLAPVQFSLFPNPASNSVWLAFGQVLSAEARVCLFNLAGQMVYTEQVPFGQERMQISVAHLPKGVYAVRVETATGVGVQKLVVD